LGLLDFLATDKSMRDLIPILRYEEDMFIMRNGCMDIVQIRTKDLYTMSDDDLNYDILNLKKFYQTYSADLKLIAMNFPTDTRRQRDYVQHRIDRTTNPVYKAHLQQQLAQLQAIQKHSTDREYYLMLFADSPDQLREAFSIASKSLGASNLVIKIDREKKYHILQQMNNKLEASSR
jgi:hypothetical protein